MATTSFHKPTNRWLTSVGVDARAGSEHTLSSGHPMCGGQFTTYRLADPVAFEGDKPLFDLDEAEVRMPNGEWATGAEIRAFLEGAKRSLEYRHAFKGATYERSSFGHWCVREA
jgi:hypothetical protein